MAYIILKLENTFVNEKMNFLRLDILKIMDTFEH